MGLTLYIYTEQSSLSFSNISKKKIFEIRWNKTEKEKKRIGEKKKREDRGERGGRDVLKTGN